MDFGVWKDKSGNLSVNVNEVYRGYQMSWFEFLFGGKNKNLPKKIHPKLGEIQYKDEGWWKGKGKINDNLTVMFFVEGTEEKIDADLAEDCNEVLLNISEYLEKAKNILEPLLIEYQILESINFGICHVSLFWRKGLDKGFTMSFFHKDDKKENGVIWTVEFVNMEAKYAGCET